MREAPRTPTSVWSPRSGAATTAPSSSSTSATSAGSTRTSSGWSRTTAAPRTSPRRSSSPRCAACARPSSRWPSSRGSTRSPRTAASTPSAAPSAPRRSPTTPTTRWRPPTTPSWSAPGPSPDAAVAAKEDLDNLCGAFGGLSETHHEILVLRELEGLSYQEIGQRMGMSRPAVESTLFRARRRLTEEYDDIVSGARCERIQGIIVAATHSALGTRDTRRLARHLSHCQGCRRDALAAGLDRELLTRPSVRERIASRVAGCCRSRRCVRFRRGADDARLAATLGPRRPLGLAAAAVLRSPVRRLGEGRRRGRDPRRRGRRRRRRPPGRDAVRRVGPARRGPLGVAAARGRHHAREQARRRPGGPPAPGGDDGVTSAQTGDRTRDKQAQRKRDKPRTRRAGDAPKRARRAAAVRRRPPRRTRTRPSPRRPSRSRPRANASHRPRAAEAAATRRRPPACRL